MSLVCRVKGLGFRGWRMGQEEELGFRVWRVGEEEECGGLGRRML